MKLIFYLVLRLWRDPGAWVLVGACWVLVGRQSLCTGEKINVMVGVAHFGCHEGLGAWVLAANL